MTYKYFPIDFSSYEEYVKYLKEKGFAVEVDERNNLCNTRLSHERKSEKYVTYKLVEIEYVL